jgi:serine phosphatase RsbU (regulator of sigma subunit)
MRKTETRFEAQIKRKADRYSDRFLMVYTLAGLLFATVYDTWLIAIGAGGLSLIAYYFSKWVLPASKLYQYVLAVVVGIFMAQFIYQMHGMFEMHFFAFIGSAFLIVYQDWRLQIPLGLMVLAHHGGFAYMQYSGIESVYFTQFDFMTIQQFTIHVCLAACIFLLCGFWAHVILRSNRSQIEQSFEIGKLQEANHQKEVMLRLNDDLRAVNELNKDITDSIRYTQRLQQALLTHADGLAGHFLRSFVFNRPHSIVGGDFLWYKQIGHEVLVACVDCTGHGVPGAFMTIVATDLLNRVAREQPDQPPSIMLAMMDAELTHSIGQEKKDGVVDGMDLALCRIDLRNKRIRFAGAMSSIIVARQDGLKIYKGDRHSLGGYLEAERKNFRTQEITFEVGDMLYLYSDGYAHQFGGPRDKKFGRSGLISLVNRIRGLPIDEQFTTVCWTFDDWRGPRHQTDDSFFAGIQLQSARTASAKAA